MVEKLHMSNGKWITNSPNVLKSVSHVWLVRSETLGERSIKRPDPLSL